MKGILSESQVVTLLKEYKIPGAQLGVVIDRSPGWVKCFGNTTSHGPAITANTVFHTASLSKPVAALGVLQLVDQGKLPLDEDITPLLAYELPWHPLVAKRMRKERRPITVRLLLQHKAGIIGRGTTPNWAGNAFLPMPWGGGSQRFVRQGGTYVPTLEEMWRGYGGEHPFMLTTLPGEQYAYSGVGYTILQHLVEQVTSEKFADYFDRVVFPALGAKSSSYQLLPPEQFELATGHTSTEKPLVGKHELAPWSAAGGLFSTVGDLQLILCTMLNSGENKQGRFLSQSLMEEICSEGLGVFIYGKGSRRCFRHGGDNGGFRALMLGYPTTGKGVIVLTNGQSTAGAKPREKLARLLIDAIL